MVLTDTILQNNKGNLEKRNSISAVTESEA